jgi:hypothetical protein
MNWNWLTGQAYGKRQAFVVPLVNILEQLNIRTHQWQFREVNDKHDKCGFIPATNNFVRKTSQTQVTI